jgi:hypothetical protein
VGISVSVNDRQRAQEALRRLDTISARRRQLRRPDGDRASAGPGTDRLGGAETGEASPAGHDGGSPPA